MNRNATNQFAMHEVDIVVASSKMNLKVATPGFKAL